jgi:multiple sugar transport system permease protein
MSTPTNLSSRPRARSAAGGQAVPAGAPTSAGRSAGKQRRRRRRGSAAVPLLFIAPGFALFLAFIIYPMVRACQMSFYDWNVIAGATSKFIGWDNYVTAYHDPIFWRALENSAFYMALTVPIQMALGLWIAVLLNKKMPGRALFRVLYYLPVVSSWVVVSLLFQYLFADSGLVNWMLHDVTHVTSHRISWLSGHWSGMAAISALGVWKGIGWSMMIFLAALQGVPKELLESAEVDGANRWQRFRAVTLPSIWPAAAFVTVMLVIGGFNVFISVLLMTNGGPADSTQVLLTYMYKQAFTYLNFGYGSAIAVLLTVGVFVLSAIQLRAFRTDAEELA